ncbi:MAG TPA: protein kinase, partial [Longimicrobiales bacterium]|nr:protein kinase [Longimicrobiales bacterium]
MDEAAARLNAALEGRYSIERELGEGGMANVFLARDPRHERQVALKVLKPEIADRVGAERFLAEIRTTASLQHPHILPLFDSGEADGLLYYVMPYVEGESLRDRLTREGKLPVEEVVRIGEALAGALHHAHRAGIIHRDLKPANVMLSGDLPIIADFGVAVAIGAAQDDASGGPSDTMGTPTYASPEQATGDGRVDERSDIYSLACVLYELLVGHPPHQAKTPQALVAKRLTVPPTPVLELRTSVPRHVDAALSRALAVDPEDRHQSAEEFRQAFSRSALGSAPADMEAATVAPIAPAATPLVGRASERDEIAEWLGAAADGRGSLVLIGGEAGVGKTRLSEFVLQGARERGFMGVVGRCYESAGTPPYTPFVEQVEYTAQVVPAETFRSILGTAAPEIARMMPALRLQFSDIGPGIELPPDQLRHHLFHRYRDFLARAAGVMPLVALFDDLQWADESSLLLLEFLTQHVHTMPVLALAAYRDTESEMSPAFSESLGRLTRQRSVHRVTLKHLTREEVAELLGSLGGSTPPGGLVDAVFERTEGNAFFVEEVFRHLSEEGRLLDDSGAWRAQANWDDLEVPEGVRLVLGRRLERVSEACRKMLTTASVIGQRFDLSVLEAIEGADVDTFLDALEEAEAAHIVQPLGGPRDPTYSFTHGLIRQALTESLSLPRLRRRHLRIAEALEAAFGARLETRASDMAHHLYNAGHVADASKTALFLRLAGDQALARSGCQEALAQYDRALSLDAEVPEALAPLLLEGKTYALDGMGRWIEAIEVGQEAAARFAAQGELDALARVSRLVVYRLTWLAQDVQAAEVGRRALEL